MPKTKEVTGRWGTLCELKEVYTTHWVQLVGDAIVRCDNDAREKGRGAWTMISPTRSATWMGGGTLVPNLDPENWIRQDHEETFWSEVDYS